MACWSTHPPSTFAGEGVTVEIDDAWGRVVFERAGVSVRVNLGDEDWKVAIPVGFKLSLMSERVERSGDGLRLGPFSVAVLEVEANHG